MSEREPQLGGSSDFDALWAELREWPGYYIEAVHPGSSSGSRDRAGGYKADGGWFREFMPSCWGITVEQDGWEPRDSWVEWASTIREAADQLAEKLGRVRADPHLLHIGLYADGYFQRGCLDCEREAIELFPDDAIVFTA